MVVLQKEFSIGLHMAPKKIMNCKLHDFVSYLSVCEILNLNNLKMLNHTHQINIITNQRRFEFVIEIDVQMLNYTLHINMLSQHDAFTCV